MKTAFEELKNLDMHIPKAETNGDHEFFENLLSPVFAFRRANGAIVDRQQFISDVAPSSQRESDLLAIDVLSRDRAIVSSVVKMSVDTRDVRTPSRFHNVRVYVRSHDREQWMLLAWANERILHSSPHPSPADHFSGRNRDQDLELWKHHASTGGDDKSKMVTVASWLLGFAAAILAYLVTQVVFAENIGTNQWWQAVVIGTVGAAISLAGGYVVVLYGGYANRNWRAADVIAWRHGWLDLLPEESRTSRESNRSHRLRSQLATVWRHLRSRDPRGSLNEIGHRLARPPKRASLAPVFEVFCTFSLIAFSAHALVVLGSLGAIYVW